MRELDFHFIVENIEEIILRKCNNVVRIIIEKPTSPVSSLDPGNIGDLMLNDHPHPP